MPLRVDDLVGSITVGDSAIELKSILRQMTIRSGLTRRYQEIEIEFVDRPPQWSVWDSLSVSCGLFSRAGDTAGAVARFGGYVTNPTETNWQPYTPKLVGQGPLAIADRVTVLADPYGGRIVGPIVPPAWWTTDDQGFFDGIDLTQGDPAGKTDSAMVLSILQLCGLGGWVVADSDIGGLPHKLGAIGPEQCIWRVGQSALAAIEMVDKSYTFRTFEGRAGFIRRQRLSPFVPFAPVYTFQEGLNIRRDSTITRQVDSCKNAVTCSGYDDGGGATIYRATGAVPKLPPGVVVANQDVDSPLIELSITGEKDINGHLVPPGLSCQEVAEEWLAQLSVPTFHATVHTKVDYPFEGGDVVYLNAPHLLDVQQAVWVQDVTITVTRNSFEQTLELIGADYSNGGPAPTAGLPVGLPVGLGG